jgi:hypothetical protein
METTISEGSLSSSSFCLNVFDSFSWGAGAFGLVGEVLFLIKGFLDGGIFPFVGTLVWQLHFQFLTVGATHDGSCVVDPSH